MPTSRAPREDMIARPAAIDSAVIITEPIAAVPLERSEISVVVRSRETIARAGAIEIAVRSKISIALESRDRIAAVESSRRKLAPIERPDVSTRKSLTLRKRIRPRAHAR
jgi:hypothetical protein